MNKNFSLSQTTVFIEIMRILRDEKNRFARKKIYEAYMDFELNKPELLDKEIRSFMEKLFGDFDEIGFLVKEFELGETLFVLYSDTIRRVWIALQTHIKHEQTEREKNDLSGSTFGHYFTLLASDAKQYRDKNNLPEPGFTDLRNL